MGFHNDRRTNGKMPANDSSDVNIPKLFTIDMVRFNWMLILRSLNLILKFLLHRISWPLFALFLSRVLQYTPSSQIENRLKLCDPIVNIYFLTSSKIFQE